MKTCTSVRSMDHRFYWKTAATKRNCRSSGGKKQVPIQNKTASSALVDIVAKNQLEWVKVYTATERNLIMEMARAGLAWDDDSEEEDFEIEDDDSRLLKLAKALHKASQANRIQYKAPHIRIVLPRVRAGYSKEVDRLLNHIRALGITLQTAEQIPQAPALVNCLSQLPVKTLHGFSVDLLNSFTDVVNLDCTILIALISDMSHAQVAQRDWFNVYVTRQIEKEKEELFLPTVFWPLISLKKLVCTADCAQRLEEIVSTIGTESEKARHRLLMSPLSGTSREERVQEFQKHSIYEVPRELRLPITVVNVTLAAMISKLPKSAEILSKTFLPLNQSVFFFGWVSGYTTVTTNGVRAKEIQKAVEMHRTSEEEAGPDIWLFHSVRSLVATQCRKGNKVPQAVISQASEV